MPWRPSANPRSTTRNGSHSARTENASSVSGMATRKPAKTLSPSGRRRRSKRTIDTSQLCPRSTWLTHVRSGFEQRGRAPVPSPQSRLLRGRSTPHRPHGSSRSSRAAAADHGGLAQRLDQLAGGADEEALGHRRAAYQNEEVRICHAEPRQEMNRSRQQVGRRDPRAGRPRLGRCAAGAGLGACSDRDRPSRVAR